MNATTRTQQLYLDRAAILEREGKPAEALSYRNLAYLETAPTDQWPYVPRKGSDHASQDE
jgi:hypothetical protein